MATMVTYWSQYARDMYLDGPRIVAEFRNHTFTTTDPDVIDYLDHRPELGVSLWQSSSPPPDLHVQTPTRVTEGADTVTGRTRRPSKVTDDDMAQI